MATTKWAPVTTSAVDAGKGFVYDNVTDQMLLVRLVTATGGGKETVVTANTGTAYTINLANGNVFDLTLTGNCTFTVTGSTANVACTITVITRQDATGGRTVTWPASVKHIGTTPAYVATASKIAGVQTLTTVDNGTTWLSFWAGGEQ